MLESAVEKRFNLLVRRLGGQTRKMLPIPKGTPDRLVIWPTGGTEFVELKKVGGVLSEAQKVQIRRLRELGCAVTVLTGKTEVEEWIGRKKQWLDLV